MVTFYVEYSIQINQIYASNLIVQNLIYKNIKYG